MVDTVRMRSSLAALFADNSAGAITPQMLRDFLASASMDWQLVDQSGAFTTGQTWSWSTNVDHVDVTGLGGFSELMVFIRGVTCASAQGRQLRFSSDGGSTFYSTSGDYVNIADSGLETAATSLGLVVSADTAALSGGIVIPFWNKAMIKPGERTNQFNLGLCTQAVAMNALRFLNTGAANFTAGKLYVYGRS